MNSILVCTYDDQLLPEKKSSGAVCRDIKIEEDITVAAGQLHTVSAWIKARIPLWWQWKVYARSGLPVKRWLMLANSVAIFDADYRGEYILQLYNFTDASVSFPKYARLAQLEFMPAYQPEHHRYWTEQIPWLEFLTDRELYNTFEATYPTERWSQRFNSTWLH